MNWTRRSAANLAEISMQAGLAPDEAERALMIGARILAHGFDQAELDDMIQHAWRVRVEDERAVGDGTASFVQTRRWLQRQGKGGGVSGYTVQGERAGVVHMGRHAARINEAPDPISLNEDWVLYSSDAPDSALSGFINEHTVGLIQNGYAYRVTVTRTPHLPPIPNPTPTSSTTEI